MKCVANLLNVVRDADRLVPDKLGLEILFIVPLHLLSLEVFILNLKGIYTLK